MAGRPQLKTFERRIEEEGGDSVILDRVAAGETHKSIANSYGISVTQLRRWFHAGRTSPHPTDPHPRSLAYKEAKLMSAESLADEAGHILDNASPATSAEATILKARADYRWKLAGIRDREQFGDAPPQVAVNVSLGDLHLQALVAKGHAAISGPEIDEAEYEEIDDSAAALPEPEE